MGEQATGRDEIIVRVAPTPAAPEDREAEERREESWQTYDALIYARHPIEMLGAPPAAPEDQPEQIGACALRARETVAVDWGHYRAYLRSFLKGERRAAELLEPDKLFGPPSPGLQRLLRGEASQGRALRVWWSTATPALQELPWELLAGRGGPAAGTVSFVRGLPPGRPVPRLPVGDKLRLAFIHQPESAPVALAEALRDLPGIEVSAMTGPPLQALQQAIRAGFELVHLVADASVSRAYEGFLYLRRPGTADISADFRHAVVRRVLRWVLSLYSSYLELRLFQNFRKVGEMLDQRLYKKLAVEILSPGELSALQHGSPLAVIGLSAPHSAALPAGWAEGLLLPSVYRAFACLGSSSLPMPNVVALIGAAEEGEVARFWRGFYTSLGAKLAVEQAMGDGLRDHASLAMALFLRQDQEQTFQRLGSSPTDSVTQINAELTQSLKTLDRLRNLSQPAGGLTGEISDLMAEFERDQVARQKQLEGRLAPWVQDDEPAP